MSMILWLLKNRTIAFSTIAIVIIGLSGIAIWFKAIRACEAKNRAAVQERTIGDYEKINKVRAVNRDVRTTADRLSNGTF